MPTSAEIVKELRHRSRLSLRQLAERSGTSSGTISHYETGKKEARLSTLEQLAAAAGYELSIELRPRLSAPERTSLSLGQAIAARLVDDPGEVLRIAHENLARQRAADPKGHAAAYHDAWEELLAAPVESLVEVLTSDAPLARELRPAAPFAGVLDEAERRAVVARAAP